MFQENFETMSDDQRRDFGINIIQRFFMRQVCKLFYYLKTDTNRSLVAIVVELCYICVLSPNSVCPLFRNMSRAVSRRYRLTPVQTYSTLAESKCTLIWHWCVSDDTVMSDVNQFPLTLV